MCFDKLHHDPGREHFHHPSKFSCSPPPSLQLPPISLPTIDLLSVPTIVPFLESHIHGAVTAWRLVYLASSTLHSALRYICVVEWIGDLFILSLLPSGVPFCGCTAICLSKEWVLHASAQTLIGWVLGGWCIRTKEGVSPKYLLDPVRSWVM